MMTAIFFMTISLSGAKRTWCSFLATVCLLDYVALRRRHPASPARPEPRRRRVAGSGTAATGVTAHIVEVVKTGMVTACEGEQIRPCPYLRERILGIRETNIIHEVQQRNRIP